MTRWTRIIGPPGTGKTSWIADHVASLPDRSGVLLISHTRAAARVLARRIDDIEDDQIGTLHAMAYRALGRPPVAAGGRLARAWDESVPEAWRIAGHMHGPDDPLVVQTPGEESMWAEMMRWRAMHPGAQPPPHLQPLAEAWTAFKREHDAVDFADMLELPVIRGLPPPRRTRLIIVDEAQDLTPAGWLLVHHWGEMVDEVIVAGDPAQAIYGWAGASPDGLVDGVWTSSQVLGQSWRLPPAIQVHAEALLRRHSGAIAEGRVYAPRVDGDAGRVDVVPWPLRDVPSTIDLILEAEEEGTVAMLTTCAYQLRPLLAELRRRGVPFWNPYRLAEAAWNPLHHSDEGDEARQPRIRTMARIRAFLRPAAEVWGERARPWAGEDAHLWIRMLRADAFAARGIRDALVRGGPGACTPERLTEALTPEAMAAAHRLDLRWLAGSVLAEYRAGVELAARVAEARGLAALGHAPQLIVGTVHSVKGGESRTVIVSPDLSTAAARDAWTREGADALIRLGYVAASRARERLAVLAPGTRLALPV